MGSHRTANIVAWDNGGGLSRDIDILAASLRTVGWSVRHYVRVGRRPPDGLAERLYFRAQKDLRRLGAGTRILPQPFGANLFLEDIAPEFLPLARANVLVPNLEYVRPNTGALLDHIDVVWAKTADAYERFAERGSTVARLGFTSCDRLLHPRPLIRAEALHIAGMSPFKGTETVLDLWSRHPEWPPLTVLRSPSAYAGEPIPWRAREERSNVSIVENRLADHDLAALQNSTLFHIAPSEAEGFGHTIVEALSVAGIVVTTDAPPMNELVTRDCGVLVGTTGHTRMGDGWRYTLDPEDLERRLTALFLEPAAQLETLTRVARARYEAITHQFHSRLMDRLNELERRSFAPEASDRRTESRRTP